MSSTLDQIPAKQSTDATDAASKKFGAEGDFPATNALRRI
jgi:hypothetical protein